MTGMDEMADGRPLTLGGWPGKGVSAGDKGKLLYTQHTGGAARDYGGGGGGWELGGGGGTDTFIQKKQNNNNKATMAISPLEKSFCGSN